MKGVIYVRDPNTKKLVRVPQLGVVNYDDTKIKQLISALQNDKVDKVPGKQLTDQNYTEEEKNKLKGIEAGAVAYPEGGYDRALYEAAGAEWHPESKAQNGTQGAYWLNDLKDITVEQMAVIFEACMGVRPQTEYKYTGKHLRTNFLISRSRIWKMNLYGAFTNCHSIEEVRFSGYDSIVVKSTMFESFFNCKCLKKISDLDLRYIDVITRAFEGLPKLEDVKIKNLQVDISFPNSALLSKESILYMIQNSAATSGITITLHPTAYAMAMADSDIQNALKEKTFVSLAEAVRTP